MATATATVRTKNQNQKPNQVRTNLVKFAHPANGMHAATTNFN